MQKTTAAFKGLHSLHTRMVPAMKEHFALSREARHWHWPGTGTGPALAQHGTALCGGMGARAPLYSHADPTRSAHALVTTGCM